VIISDLQYVESATENDVQGGNHRPNGNSANRATAVGLPDVFGSLSLYNEARAEAVAQAFGTNTRTFTTTDTLVIQGQFSGSSSSSFAEAF
jgi:hypothetical protein